MNYTEIGYKAHIRQKDMNQWDLNRSNFLWLGTELAEAAKNFYRRGGVLGTSGNFSALISMYPLQLAITAAGLDTGGLTTVHFVEIDGETNVMCGNRGSA
jgi:ribulose-5-phosphate 4-epimerase/fuculose-1-phosphate aldolase